jgi:hypothetical protein
MSRDGSVNLDWADGHYCFRLAWGELIKVQEECKAGPFAVLRRLTDGTWRLEDIREVIRWALIGGGKTPEEALRLIRDYVESRPPLENLMFARGILAQAIHGAPDEEPGEAEAAPETESA